MVYELIYTDWKKGIRPKDTNPGYCTVAYTQGMPANLVNRAERFAGYSYPKGTTKPPCSISYYITVIGGQSYAVFCCVSPIFRSGRRVYIAHVIMCLAEELPKGSTPIDVVSSPGFFRDDWNEEPRLLEPHPPLPTITPAPAGELTYWKRLAVDAGWAGTLQQDVKDDFNTRVNIIVSPDADVIQLIREATVILPPEQTWNATFNTYYHIGVSQDTRCAWRFCLAESDIIRDLLRDRKARLLDMTTGRLPGIGTVTPLVEAARAGIRFVESLHPGRRPLSPTNVIKQSQSEGVADKTSNTAAPDRRTSSQASKQPKGSSRQRRGVPWPVFAAVAAFVVILGTIAIVKVVSPPPPVVVEKPNPEKPENKKKRDDLPEILNVSTQTAADDKTKKIETTPATNVKPPSDQEKKTEPVPTAPPAKKPDTPTPPPLAPVKIVRRTAVIFVNVISNSNTKLDLPWQVELTSEKIKFMSSAGEHLKVSKLGAFGSGAYSLNSLNKQNQYQELRVSASKQLEFGGGVGTQLPFLVELAAGADSETNDQLFVICPRTDFVASLITNPAISSVTLQLNESAAALAHLAKATTNLEWTVQIAGANVDIACKPAVFGDNTIELRNADLFKKNKEVNDKRRKFATEMTKTPLDKKNIDHLLKSLSHEVFSGSLADPLRTLTADILRARIKNIEGTLSKNESKGLRPQTLDTQIKENIASTNRFMKDLDDLKLKDEVKKLLDARRRIKILEEAEVNQHKANKHLEHVKNEPKLKDQIPSAEEHLKNAEKNLAKTRKECGACREEEIKYAKHTFGKDFDNLSKRIDNEIKKLKPLLKEREELDESKKERDRLKTEKDNLEKLSNALKSNSLSLDDFKELLTYPEYMKVDAQVFADIHARVIEFFKDRKGDDLIAEHTRERVNFSKVSVRSGDTLIAVIPIVEGKRDNSTKNPF